MVATSDTLSLTPLLSVNRTDDAVDRRAADRQIQENLRRIEDWARRITATLADHEARITVLEP